MNNRVSALTRDSWIAVALAFVLGLFVGWLLLGWVLFPVQYTNADPSDLNATAKEQYVSLVADSFALNHDVKLARERLRWFTPDEQTRIINDLIAQSNQQGAGPDAARLATFGVSIGLTLTTAPGAAPSSTSGAGGLLTSLGPWLLLLLLLIVVVVLAFLFYPRFRGQGATAGARTPKRIQPPYEETPSMTPVAARPMAAATAAPASTAPRTAPISMPAPQAAPRAAAGGKSLGTFAATYKFGDDNYDTAFTLETARNEFLGECGMGISETVGEGKPDKVTAFDLWLFDKTDVRTVTQILMTEHAYGDQTLRSHLAQKGELTLAEKGKHIPLQTATLRVDATIVDLVYASTPGLPPNSHFQKLIVEMIATQN
jgi:hypothetical protein